MYYQQGDVIIERVKGFDNVNWPGEIRQTKCRKG